MAALGKSLLRPAIDLPQWIGSRKCWHCGKQLQRKAGGGYYFARLRDPLGNELRIHMGCVPDSIGNGFAEIKAETKRESE